MIKPYTDKEILDIQEMRKAGKSWPFIAKAVDRNPKAIYAKFSKTVKAAQRKAREPLGRRRQPSEVKVEVSPATRPMVAFIGSPSEITQSIRELFS